MVGIFLSWERYLVPPVSDDSSALQATLGSDLPEGHLGGTYKGSLVKQLLKSVGSDLSDT